MPKLTLDQLLEQARLVRDHYRRCGCGPDEPERQLAEGVLALLEEGLPCGYESATANEPPYRTVNVPHQWCGDHRPSDACALAASLLRAADEAEKGTSRG